MSRRSPRLALCLLRLFGAGADPLVGDILEAWHDGASRRWLWKQVAAAAVTALRDTGEIRPLKLLDQQPLDAIERTLAIQRRQRKITPSPSPLPGSLGLVILGGLITALAPIIWWGLLVTFIGGLGFARVLIRVHERHDRPHLLRRIT